MAANNASVSPYVIHIRGNVAVAVPGSVGLITPYVLLEQEDWFEAELAFVRRWFTAGMIAIDIGANYGVYTLTLARAAGAGGQVLAVEPHPQTVHYLSGSVQYNALQNVTVVEAALSDTRGSGTLLLHSHSELNRLGSATAPDAPSIAVPLETLDSIAAAKLTRPVDFCKIDAEGNEAQVIRGGKAFFAQHSPLVMFELRDSTIFNDALITQFQALGYRPYVLVPGLHQLLPFDAAAPRDPMLLNLFACKDDRARDLAAQGWMTMAVAAPSAVQQEQPTLRNIVAAHGMAHAADTPAPLRYGYLLHARTLAQHLVDTCASAAGLMALARLCSELGQREHAAAALARLIQHIANTDCIEWDEPLLAVAPRYDEAARRGDVTAWCLGSAIAERERLCAFSSYYTGSASLANLELLTQLSERSPDMARRRALIRLRHGLPMRGQEAAVLYTRSVANLNPDFWRAHQA